jgi:hypothetical protein
MTYRYPGGLVRRTAANTAITGASGVWDLGSQAQAVRNNTWPISGLANPVSGSLRFRASASATLSRTPTVAATSTTKGTISLWFKGLGQNQQYLVGKSPGTIFYLYFNSSSQLVWQNGGVNTFITTQVFRDPSAWYHLVASWDTTQATSSNRQSLYLNGQQITAFGTTNNLGSSATVSWFDNDGNVRGIGSYNTGGYFDGYMAEINAIDGQALTPASFGQTSAITGVWEPIKYTGTYGTNGFYLSLSDTSSIGKDFSGNGNNWTPNNFSTANDSTFDLMRDVPTQWAPQGVTDVGGVVRGNYATFNPLLYASSYGYRTLSNANLTTVGNSATNNGNDYSTQTIKTGKWYAEFTCSGASGIYPQVGIISVASAGTGTGQVGYVADSCGYFASGVKKVDGGSDTSYGNSFTTNDVIGIAVDADNGAVYFSKNGTFQNSGVPTSGSSKTGAADTWTGGATEFYFATAVYQSGTGWSANFGQRPFAYTPPTGFKSLCTTNLPTPTISQSSQYMNATLWSGNNTSNREIITGGRSDFVWIKRRDSATSHILFDAIRGAGKTLYSHLTSAEVDNGGYYVQTFGTTSFTLGTGGDAADNITGGTYVGWNWNAGGSTVTNTAGSISTQVRANPTAGFSIVTYSGNGTGGATIGHGLGVAPSMMIFKPRNATGSWLVWHTGYNSNQAQMLLDSTAAIYNPGNGLYFNSTYPSSTVATLGTSSSVNDATYTYVAYMFAAVAGFSAFGSYTGNGSTDGPFIYTGFRPRFVMVKTTSNAGYNWNTHDAARNPNNSSNLVLYPNTNAGDDAYGAGSGLDILSNGFKPRDAGGGLNGSGFTYIYMAFAEHPFKNALAR